MHSVSPELKDEGAKDLAEVTVTELEKHSERPWASVTCVPGVTSSDGASVMLGKDAGWSKRLDEKARAALSKDQGSAWNGRNSALWCTGHLVNLGVLDQYSGFCLHKKQLNKLARSTRTHSMRKVFKEAAGLFDMKFWTVPRIRKLRFVAHMLSTFKALIHDLPIILLARQLTSCGKVLQNRIDQLLTPTYITRLMLNADKFCYFNWMFSDVAPRPHRRAVLNVSNETKWNP